MVQINNVPPEYIKARLKNNKIKYFKTLPQNSQESDSYFRMQFAFKNSSEISVATGNQSDNLHPTLMKRKLRLTEQDLEPLFLNSEKNNSLDISLKEYFSKPKNILKIISYSLLVMNLYWVMGLTVFLPEKMGFKSLYLNNFLLAFADLFGVSMMALFLNNTRRSALNTFHLSLIFISSSILLLLQFSSLNNYEIFKFIDLFLSCNR